MSSAVFQSHVLFLNIFRGVLGESLWSKACGFSIMTLQPADLICGSSTVSHSRCTRTA